MLVFASSAQETLVLRTDRDLYIAGEPVWLTLNCLKSGTSENSNLSTVAYLEVLNGNNEPVSQFKLFLNDGRTSTQIILPDTLSTGNYLLRAYTKWLRNYASDLFYSKNIAVINPFSRNAFPKAEYIFSSDTVFFYPESGKVISGKTNRILIKSFDRAGQPCAVSGNIISPAGDTLQQIQCDNTGISAISVLVSESGKYRFTKHGSESEQAAFATSENLSHVFIQEEDEDQIVFAFNRNRQESTTRKLDIITALGGFVKSYTINESQNPSLIVNASELPSGYLSALLIDNTGTILASRYFIRSGDTTGGSIKINLDPDELSQRSEVKLNIENPENLSQVSVSVVKESLLNYQSQLAFSTTPLEIPQDYLKQFAGANVSINDLLMAYQPLTTIVTRTKDLFLPERKGEIISGTVVTLNTQEAIRNESFMLSFVGKYPTLDICRTDESGRFYFENNRYGEQEIVIQPFKNESLVGNFKVNLDLQYCTTYPKKSAAPLFIDQANMDKINEAIVNMQVNALYNSYNPFPPIRKEHSFPPAFYGVPNSSTKLTDYIELPNMEEIIREIIPQASIVKKDDQFSISIAAGDLAYSREINSFCLIDGVPVKNQDNILKMNAQQIERIDVENRDVFVKEFKIGKIFSLITKDGNMGAFDFDKRIFRQSYHAFQPQFEFNSPDYSSNEIKTSRLPDFRNVLYWNPNLGFTDQNQAEIRFFTSDENAVYKVVVEGINENGMLEHKEAVLEVGDKM